jgi:single-strand DNA-binding protein
MDNAITIVGNLTRDPELRYTPNGAAVANFGVAVNDRKRVGGTDKWEDDPSFFDVTAWDELAVNASESLGRGNRVIVTGKLKQRSWETSEGDKRSKVEIIAHAVGPDLRWATATVTRTEKKDSNGSARPTAKAGARRATPADYDDQEPF